MSCFVTRCKIFSMITHQAALREAQPNKAPFFSEVGLKKFVLTSELLYPGLILYVIQQPKDARRYHGSLFNLFFEECSQS